MSTDSKPKLSLPTEFQEPSKRWTDQKFLMIGMGKIGKSEFWSMGEKTLFLETEPGLNHLRVKKVSLRSWDDIGQVYVLLYDSLKTGFQYDTIVVDTIDRLISLAHEEAVMRAKQKFSKMADQINSIGDIPEGMGWYWVSSMMDNVLNKFKEFPTALVLIGHVQNKEVKEPSRSYHKDTINIGGQLGIRLIHWADHTLHVRSRLVGDKLQRIIRTKPTDTMEAGSRGNVVPDGLEWSPDAKANYEAFRKLFQ